MAKYYHLFFYGLPVVVKGSQKLRCSAKFPAIPNMGIFFNVSVLNFMFIPISIMHSTLQV